MLKHTTSTVLMVRPVRFGYNPQTAANNAFQTQEDAEIAQANALEEFNAYVQLLQENGIEVIVVDDTEEPHTPDSIFPNNWFTTHQDGTLVIFPLFAPNRRFERKEGVLQALNQHFSPRRTIDLTHWEEKGEFLEGTGSMILDRIHQVAYACRSPRTSLGPLQEFCEKTGFRYHLFSSVDEHGVPIYHTNVMMSLGTKHAMICLSSIQDEEERKEMIEAIEGSGRTILDLTIDQIRSYAGNMMELTNQQGESCLVLSQTALRSLNQQQLAELQRNYRLISPHLDHIEKNGGGSARCMIAEIF
ncbi:MAG: amidinotransferase [Bacteroidales bacterium]|nr:amidinotransferase [Bacteroidales bacterium]